MGRTSCRYFLERRELLVRKRLKEIRSRREKLSGK